MLTINPFVNNFDIRAIPVVLIEQPDQLLRQQKNQNQIAQQLEQERQIQQFQQQLLKQQSHQAQRSATASIQLPKQRSHTVEVHKKQQKQHKQQRYQYQSEEEIDQRNQILLYQRHLDKVQRGGSDSSSDTGEIPARKRLKAASCDQLKETFGACVRPASADTVKKDMKLSLIRPVTNTFYASSHAGAVASTVGTNSLVNKRLTKEQRRRRCETSRDVIIVDGTVNFVRSGGLISLAHMETAACLLNTPTDTTDWITVEQPSVPANGPEREDDQPKWPEVPPEQFVVMRNTAACRVPADPCGKGGYSLSRLLGQAMPARKKQAHANENGLDPNSAPFYPLPQKAED